MYDLRDVSCLEDSLRRAGFGDVIDSPFFQRLRGVSFLSTLDFVYAVQDPTSRYDHSIAAAYLALLISEQLRLTDLQREVLVIGNLLHDIGHAPFSHNSEPFLLENKNMYHQGLLTTYLRYNKSMSSSDFSVGELLIQRSSSVGDSVTDLILKRSQDPVLSLLFGSPLNCDKLDGNYRTMDHIRKGGINPEEMLDCFVGSSDRVGIRRRYSDKVADFWDMEKQMYWSYIYVDDVFAAEAMITRALELVFTDARKVDSFIVSTDAEVMYLFDEDQRAREISHRLRRCQFFRPVSVTDPDLLSHYRNDLLEVRFDKGKRRKIEAEIGRQLGADPLYVVSHFSRRKYFQEDYGPLFQPSLFELDPDIIDLSDLNRSLIPSKVSGDFFDIFYLQ